MQGSAAWELQSRALRHLLHERRRVGSEADQVLWAVERLVKLGRVRTVGNQVMA